MIMIDLGSNDKVLLIGAGITLHEAISAAEQLSSKHQISARVIDPFTIKPLDRQTILSNAREVGGRIVTVEDHYPEGDSKGFNFCLFLIIVF